MPALAHADPRIEARRHFRKGMSLIAEGSFSEGIQQLQEAYNIRPHINVLYNIARAYHDAGRVNEALEFYDRYLAGNPPDAEPVRATVQQLRASLAAVSKPPKLMPETRTELPPPTPRTGTSTPSGGGLALDKESMERFKALTERLETAVAKAELLGNTPTSGGASGSAPSSESSPPSDTASDTSEGAPYEEQVVTASRRAQSTLEAPNATTVITGDEIRASGATTLVDLLRRVPGADVMVMGAGSANVSLRGFDQRLANKVLVLLDGRTEYQDFLGLTVWSSIPVGLDEIERIEIIRGPGSALYGANAMLGIINIITRAPGTGPGATFAVRGGTGNSASGSFVASGGKTLRYRASVGYDQADKWSLDFADGRPDIHVDAQDSHLGLRSGRANLSAVYAFNPDVSVGVSAGVNRLYTELYPLGLLRNYSFDGLTAYAKTDFTVGPLKLKLFWNHLDARSAPEYTAVGEESIPAVVASNVFDAEFLFSKEFELLGTHRLVLGVEGRIKQIDWNYLLEKKYSETHAAAFVQDEWRILPPLRIVASYRVDFHPLLEYKQSPRVSAVWIPVEGQALRAGISTAFREPTFLESYTNVHIAVPGQPGASVLTRGSTTLDAESLTAYELGYRGDIPILGLEYDLALYQNNVSNLIRLSGLLRDLPSYYDQDTNTYLLGRSVFENDKDTRYAARGVELGVKLSLLDGLDLRLSGAYESISATTADGTALDRNKCGACTQTPTWKLHGGLSYHSKFNFDFGLDATWVDKTTWVERETNPADLTAINEVNYSLPSYAVVSARVAYRFLEDRASVALQGTNLGVPHSEHPLGNRITQRFFVTLTVTP